MSAAIDSIKEAPPTAPERPEPEAREEPKPEEPPSSPPSWQREDSVQLSHNETDDKSPDPGTVPNMDWVPSPPPANAGPTPESTPQQPNSDWADIPDGGGQRRTAPAGDGGPDWDEYRNTAEGNYRLRPGVKDPQGGGDWTEQEREVEGGTDRMRFRSVPATDGKPDWLETDVQGHRSSARSYEEEGVKWSETRDGENRFRYREGGLKGLSEESAARGQAVVDVGDGQQVVVHGGATPEELERVRETVSKMPARARGDAREIFLSENLGQILDPTTGEFRSQVAGMNGASKQGQMVVDRGNIGPYVINHEAGHNLDHELGLSNRGLWGGNGSVSEYGTRNNQEDFAEVHRTVLTDWDRLNSMSPDDWSREPAALKKAQLLRYYSGKAPTDEEILRLQAANGDGGMNR